MWVVIKEFPSYSIDEEGLIKNNKTNRILKTTRIDNNGYYRVALRKSKKNHIRDIHRLKAIAFIPNPFNYPLVDHKDRNKQNNTLDNLRWATHSINNLNRSKLSSYIGMYLQDNNWIVVFNGVEKKFVNLEEAFNYLKECSTKTKSQ